MNSVKVCLFILGLLAATVGGVRHGNLTEKFAWKQLDFAWSTDDARQEALSNRDYIPKNNLVLAFDIWRNKIFVTVPRWRHGVVSTLNYIDVTDEKSAPILHPFPTWQMNKLEQPGAMKASTENRTRIVSSFGIRADECDRLWVIDAGVTDILGKPEQIQSPSILIFDLNTNQLIRRFEIPSNQIKSDSFFVNIVVDATPSRCEESFAYLTDVYEYALIVYDFKRDKSWRVDHHYFHFDPVQGNLLVGGVIFQWHDGIFGMALGDAEANGDRTVYFHAMISSMEFSVPNSVLKDENSVGKKTPEFYNKFKRLGSRGERSQSTIEVFDPVTKVVFYTLISQNAIGCYNTAKPFSLANQGIVARDDAKLIFPNDLRVDGLGSLYVLSNRLPVFMFQSLKPNDYNFRILIGNTRDLIRGTPCE